jgi:hypothetical protein
MSSKAGLRAKDRLEAAGKLRQIRSIVRSDVALLQNSPDKFVEAQFDKVVTIAVKLHQEQVLLKAVARYAETKKQAESSVQTQA